MSGVRFHKFVQWQSTDNHDQRVVKAEMASSSGNESYLLLSIGEAAIAIPHSDAADFFRLTLDVLDGER